MADGGCFEQTTRSHNAGIAVGSEDVENAAKLASNIAQVSAQTEGDATRLKTW